MPPTAKQPCSVCGEQGDGAHFGAEACRACAAFFRRSVALAKTYTCRNSGSCNIQSNIRCMCRSCRFNKCLAVGMKKSAVQRHRDMLGKRLEGSLDCDSNNLFKAEPECPTVDFHFISEEQGMPILMQLKTNYTKLDNVRRVIHNREGDSVFSIRQPRAIAYKEATGMHMKEMNLVADWVINSYTDFSQLHSEQKKLMFRNFFLPFMLLESGFKCALHDRTDIVMLPSGDYIDCTRPETFYRDLEGQQHMSTEDAVRLFAPSFEIYRRNILDPMRSGKTTHYEFFALCSLVLWDHGIDGQTEDCEHIARSVRNQIFQELMFYYKFVLRESEYSLRMANLLVILPSLQRAVRRFQEDVEISHVFNVYSVDESFYDLVNGRF